MTIKQVEFTTKEVIFVQDSDRHIVIWRRDGEVSGINYCQGDFVEDLIKHYGTPDVELTAFFLAVVDLIRFKTDNIYEQIDHAIWMHWDFQQNKDLVEVIQN
jgi:hypothetical protein